MLSFPSKLVSEQLDYAIDWSFEIGSDVIVSSDFEVISGDVVIEQTSFEAQVTVIWLSGGSAETSCILENTIGTMSERTYAKKIFIQIRDG